ncbi:MAG: amidohydrolase [Pseudomonadota bacterium]
MNDLVIVNGKVITFDGPDAQALAIKGGVITAVGSTSEILDLAGLARVIDAQGATVLPGFIDSHVHLFGGGTELEFPNLNGVSDIAAMAGIVQPYAAMNPDHTVLFANSLDYEAFGRGPVTRHDLDQVIPDRPFAAMAADGHTAWANSKALERAGLLHGATVADGSEIVMAPDGLASGELREPDAYGPVLALTAFGGRDHLGMTTGRDPVSAPTLAERSMDKSALANGLKQCASHGITGLHNMDGNFYQLELLEDLKSDGALLCRTEIPLHLKPSDPINRLSEAIEMQSKFGCDMLWSGCVKMFMDGVLDSRTAYMLQPYPGTDECGAPLFAPDQFNEICQRADAQNLRMAVHAIGDAAVRQTLDGYQHARQINGVRDSRHRIEHIETIHPDDIPRIAQLGAVASMQPLHAPRGGFFLPACTPGDILHDFQIQNAFAWQTIRDTGAAMLFSTDWPVVPVDVMPTIQGAVAGVDLPKIWPDQRQRLRDALASYTRENAWAEFNEHCKGRLRAGMLADVVVMDHDLESMPPDQLGTAKAAVTICNGHITFEA